MERQSRARTTSVVRPEMTNVKVAAPFTDSESLRCRLFLLTVDFVALGQDFGGAFAQHKHVDDTQDQPGRVNWADKVQGRGWQRIELEEDDHDEQTERDRWQDHMPEHTKFCAVFAQVKERH